ncbi:MAG: hypothetical protein HJJLKODD_00809 [Phycisphaerae bacterium]|nr:hypothetical protein [Phycisphaerae bacterium]
MKSVALIPVNLQSSWLNTASRLGEDLAGRTVLARTIDRLASARRLTEMVIVTPKDQQSAAQKLVDRPGVIWKTYDGVANPAAPTIRLARRWSLASWRGGIGNTTCFDEVLFPALADAVVRQQQADVLVSVHPDAALLDPQLLDDLLGHYEQHRAETRMAFAVAPPGMVPALFAPELLAELARNNAAVGWLNTYRPDTPASDIIRQPGCLRTPVEIQNATGRLLADTRRGFELLQQICAELSPAASAAEMGRWLLARRRTAIEPWPVELHIELTTADSLPHTRMRPRGTAVSDRGPLPLSLLEQLRPQLAAYDDLLVVLGGFGDPLLHPQFAEIAQWLHSAPLAAWVIRTSGLALDAATVELLIQTRPDFVQILLDANSPETYQQIHGVDGFDRVIANIHALEAARHRQDQLTPAILVSQTKANETLGEMEKFYDRWVKVFGWAMVEGYSHYARQLPDRMVLNMAPPKRHPCRRIRRRLTLLADGQWVACDEDFKGLYPLGRLSNQSLAETWNSAALTTLHEAHVQQNYSTHPLCATCDEWHRP